MALGLACTAPVAAQAPDWSQAARQRLFAPPGSIPADVFALRNQALAEGERWLASGDTVAALDAFDRAAMMLHAPDTEAALVRGQMQAGRYGHALAFGAHAAGAHRREWPAGMALYAWLLQMGGQGVVARRFLDESLALAPDDAALRQARLQLAQPWPRSEGLLLVPPLQVAPYAVGAEVPPTARCVGTALLVQGGSAALVPADLLGSPPAVTLWVRNGLGQTMAAVPESDHPAVGLVLLRLQTALPAATLASAVREPFGGSPGAMVEFAPGDASAQWPLLRQGFFARIGSAPGPRHLGIDAPNGPRGGPVFDRAGQLAGMAVTGADGVDRLIGVAALVARFGAGLWAAPGAASPAEPSPTPGAGLEAVYEQALPVTLQVLLPAR